MARFCPSCGKKLDADAKFCPYCGQNLTQTYKLELTPNTVPTFQETRSKSSIHKKKLWIALVVIIVCSWS